MNANTKILVLLFVLAVSAVMVYTVFTIGAIIAIFLLSALFAFILSPSVNYLESIGLHRTVAAVVMFVAFFAAIGAAFYFVTPFLVNEISGLQEIVSVGQLRRGVRDLESFLSRNLSFLGVRRLHIAPKVEEWVGAVIDNAFNIASGLVGGVLFVVMTLISTFFLLKDSRSLKKRLICQVPNRFFEMSLSILHKIEWSIGAYLRGILLDALVICAVSMFALWLIGVPNYVLIGLVAGVANLVPYLGPPTAALVASFVSAISFESFSQVPLILFVFAAIRLFDDSVVQPLTISQTVRLHPLIIIFAILVGGQLFGIIGMLFAVPVAGVLKVVLSELNAGLQRYRTS